MCLVNKLINIFKSKGKVEKYVLHSSKIKASDLYYDFSLADQELGAYICDEGSLFCSAVAYIDTSECLTSLEVKQHRHLFLKELREEADVKGYLSNRGDWSEF